MAKPSNKAKNIICNNSLLDNALKILSGTIFTIVSVTEASALAVVVSEGSSIVTPEPMFIRLAITSPIKMATGVVTRKINIVFTLILPSFSHLPY